MTLREFLETNKDYIIKQTEENTWFVIDNTNGEVVHTITKDSVIKYCKEECEDIDTYSFSAEIMIDSIWWCIDDEYDLEFVDADSLDWEKFTAWFDYVCVEYFAQELVASYKKRLLNFE